MNEPRARTPCGSAADVGLRAGQRRLLSLRDDVAVTSANDDRGVVLVGPWGSVPLGRLSAVDRDALWRLTLGPVDPANMVRRRASRRDEAALADLLRRLGGLVVHSLGPGDGGAPFLSVVPTAPDVEFAPRAVTGRDHVRLSPCTMLPRGEHGLRLESALAPFRVDLHRAIGARTVALLADSHTVVELAELAGARADLVADLVAHLAGAGVVHVAEPQDRSRSD